MAKAKRKDASAQRTDETYLQWQSRLAAERVTGDTRDVLNPFAASQGCYVDDFAPDDEGNLTRVKRNAAVCPVTQWRAQGMLEPHHDAVIKLCGHLWEFKPPMPRITSSYGEQIPGNDDGEESEDAVNAYLDAKDRLERIEGYFPDRLRHYWTVFENCVRHDMAAGVAGADLGFTSRSGRAKAHVIVCMVCDKIADKEGL